MKTKIYLTAVLLVLSAFTTVMSQGRDHGQGRRWQEMAGLNLSDDQKTEMKSLKAEMQKQVLPVRLHQK